MDTSSHIKNMAIKLFLEGHDLIAIGAYESAEVTLQKCLRTYAKIYGPDHFAVATAHELLGHVYFALQKKEQADIHYSAALRISRVLNKTDNSVEAKCLPKNKSENLQEKGFHSTASTKETFSHSFESKSRSTLATGRMKSSLPLEYEDEAKTSFYEGKQLIKQGQYKDAIKPLQQSMRSTIMIYGDNHPDVAAVHEMLGSVFSKLGDSETAQFHSKAMLRITETIKPPSQCDDRLLKRSSKTKRSMRRWLLRSETSSKSSVRALAA